jgi:ribosomal peptide maturation radical SAM protein 1
MVTRREMRAPVEVPIVEQRPTSDSRSGRSLRVALVNMPFAAAHRPSIACGLLKAGLLRFGHQVDVFYLNMELAAEIGAGVYDAIASVRTDQFLGEWLFTAAAFGSQSDEAAYLATCPSVRDSCRAINHTFDDLCRLRNDLLPAIVDRWLDGVDWGAYDIAGFTSTFEQNVAALALARRIKERYPGTVTVFGGANYDGEMGPEYVRAFPWIDYAVSGEGDAVFPALVARIARDEDPIGLPGVTGRDQHGMVVSGGEAPAVRDMDALPDPDYDEFFATLRRLGVANVAGNASPLLLFESARGCWWGAKHHCTFCGLNANGMAYRSKSPARVHAELRRLSTRYQIANFDAVDNIIDMRYLEELCRPIADERLDYTIFYEVKANLTRDQLRTMRRGGINTIQPGIESLSTHVLGLMRKGTTLLRNVRLLKWAHYYGMRVSWNLLFGFPGETQQDYAQQEAILPLLTHLPPPGGCGPLWLERFSPYFFDETFPIRNKRPRAAYRHIYPQGTVDLEKIAYFFDYDADGILPIAAHASLVEQVAEWQRRWDSGPRPYLVYQRAPEWLQIVDRRGSEPQALSLQGVEAAAYEHCGDTDHTPERVASFLRAAQGAEIDAGSARAMLRRFCTMGLMIEDEDHFLSLALPANGNW